MTEVIAAVLGALLGVAGALVANIASSRRSERVTMTASLIAEYFSASFLQHRISIGNTTQGVRTGTTTFDEIASGYWYPGTHDAFTGETLSGLNEHQHIEAYIGFIVRIEYLLSVERIYASEIRRVLGMKLVWESYLMAGVVSACEEQTRTAGVEPPDWVRSAKVVQEQIVVHAAERGNA